MKTRAIDFSVLLEALSCVVRRASCVVILMTICALPLFSLQAGGGPENTLVVVNPTAEGSMEIANLFQQLRGIPEKNMYYLPASSVNWDANGVNGLQGVNVSMSSDDFRSRILVNVMNYIKQQGLTNQIDYIVYSSDFPNQISPSADDPGCSWNPSLTTATIFADYVQTAGTMSIAANNYVNWFRDALSPGSPNYSWYLGSGIDGTTTNLAHKTVWGSGGTNQYYVSAILGWTGYHGNTVAEITNMLVRSAQADGTFPSGSVYMDVNSDIRSTTRQFEFGPAQAELQSLGRSTIITTNNYELLNQTNVVGGVLGWAVPVIPAGSTFAKGSIVDSLTSNAATWNDTAQTKCTRWIAVGASGTSGQVEEPYAYWQKFPTARMHAHYARGCTMGEAQCQSIAWPTDGLILGDPLCRPFAIIPSVSLSGLTEGQTVSGTNVTLTPSATTTSPSGISGYDLYLDGALWQSLAFGSNTTLDTTKISDGSHELRVVANENSVIRTQGNLVVDFQVNNAGQSITVTPSSLTTPWNGGTFSLTATAVGGSPASINILKGQKVVGTISGSSGTAVMNQSDVGVGASILRASAAMSSGTVQSVKVPVLLQPAANLTPPAVINWSTSAYAGLYNTYQVTQGNVPTFNWQFNKPIGTATNVQVLIRYKYGYEMPVQPGYNGTPPSHSTNWYQNAGLSSNTWSKSIYPNYFISGSPEEITSGNVPVIISGTDDNGTAFSYTNAYPNLDLTPPQLSALALSTNFVQAGQTATIQFTSTKLLMSTNTASSPATTVTNLVAVGTNLATFVSSNGLNYVYNFTPSASTPAGSNAVVITAADSFGNTTSSAITSDDFESNPVGWLVSSNDARWVYGWSYLPLYGPYDQPYVTNDVAATGSQRSLFFPARDAVSWKTSMAGLTMPQRETCGWVEFDIYPDNATVSVLNNRGFTVAGWGIPISAWDTRGDHEAGLVFAQDAAAISNGTYNLVMDLPTSEVFPISNTGLLYGMTNGAPAVPYSSSEAGLVTLATGISTKAWHHVRFGNDVRAHTYTVELDGTLYADHVPYNPLTNGEYEAKSYYYNNFSNGSVGTNGIYNINSIYGYVFTAVGDNYHLDNLKISGGPPVGVGGYPPLSIFVGNPPVANSQSVTMLVNRSQAITLTTNDPDSLTYSVSSPPHGTLSGTAPNLTYTPNANYTGADSFTFTATDTVDGLTSNVATVSITVNAPTANNQSVTVGENTAKAITLTTNDTNPVTYSVGSPAHGTLSGTAPNLTYTPNTGYTGTDSFTFYVTDGTVNSNVATVSITVEAPPVANNGSFATDANTSWDQIPLSASGGSGSLTYSVVTSAAHGTLYIFGSSPAYYTPNTGYTGSDSFTFKVTDGAGVTSNTATISVTVNPDPVANNQSATTDQNTAKAVTLTATGGTGSLTYSVVANPTHGTLSGTAPNLTYTPNTGYTGSDSFTFKATDGIVTSSAATVSLTVNTDPVANNQSATTDQNTAKAVTLTATGGSGPLTYSVAANPTHGTLSGTAPNLTYTPNTGYNGADSFTFNATDGIATSNTATVSLTVNASPVANNQSATTDQNTAKAVTLTATGGSGSLTYSVVANPTNGTLSGTAPNLTYTPNTGYTGSDSFTFNATDGIATSNTATVSLTVNAPPVANNQSVTTNLNVAKAVTLTATGGSGSLTYSVAANPTHGTLSGTAPNLTYTPNTGYTGADSWTFNATDGMATSNTATVSLTVNASPVANNQSATTDQNTAKAVTLTATGGSGSLTYSVVANPTHGTLSGTAPNLTYTPNTGYTGSDSFTFNATDGVQTSNTATVSLTVNASPVANNQSAATDQNTTKAVTLTATGGTGSLTYSVVASPAHGTLSGTAPNLTYTPTTGYTGADSFTFKATDGIVTSNTATVSLTVNASPVANNQSVTLNENTAQAVTLTGSGGSGSLTYSVVASPTHGTLSGTAPNLTYTPASKYHGSDSFTFNTTDGIATSNTATVSLTVTKVELAPVAQSQSVNVTENTATTVTLTASDADGDPVTYSVVTSPSHGLLSGTTPNLTYTPVGSYLGSDSFTFKANDGVLDSNVATVSLTVSAAPVTSATSSSSGSGISGASGTNSAPSYVYGTSPASYSSGPAAVADGVTSHESRVASSESQALGSNGNETPGNQSSILNPPIPSSQGYFGAPVNPVSFPMPMPMPPPTIHHEPEPTLIRRSTFDVRHPMQKERTEPSSSDVEHRTPASPRLGEGGSNVEHRTSNVERGAKGWAPVQVGVAALFALGSLVATLVSYGRKIGNFFKMWKK